MKPFGLAIVANVLTPEGGTSKCVGLIFKHLNRRFFEPRIITETPVSPFAGEYGIPESSFRRCVLSDPASVARALEGCEIAFVVVGSANNTNEYELIFSVGTRIGVKVRVLSCVFGLGTAVPSKADLFLCYSMDAFLEGSSCPGAYASYCPVPRHEPQIPRDQFRRELGIHENAFVIAYACADHRTEFYRVAESFQSHADTVFVSALGRHDQYGGSPNIIFLGGLRQRQMASLYDAADVVLHTRTESFGYSVYQGIAAGKPIVALWTNSRNAFAEAMWPQGGYLARDVEGARLALDHVKRNRAEAGDRAKTALGRIMPIVPELQVPRVEALILKKLMEKGLVAETALEPCHRAFHWPGPSDIEIWKRAAAEIESSLRRTPFL